MFYKTFLFGALMLASGAAMAANSSYVEACADMQQQANSKITRSKAVKACQCIESRQDSDLEKIQAMDNPTQAQIRKVMEDTARYCIKKAGIANSGKTSSKKPSSSSDESESESKPTIRPGGTVGGIPIRGIR